MNWVALVIVRVDDRPSGNPMEHESALGQIGESSETPLGSATSVTHAGTRDGANSSQGERTEVHGDLRTVELTPDKCGGLDHMLGLVGCGAERCRERPRSDAKADGYEDPEIGDQGPIRDHADRG